MTYFLALIIFLLPSYLIRFSVFGIPTTMLEVLIYIAFFWAIILKISNNKSQITNPSILLGTGKSQISNSKPEIDLYLIHNTRYLIPIVLFIISGVISVVIAPDKREALGLLKAYILDPVIFFSTILMVFRNQNVDFNKDDKSQIPNPKSQINLKSQTLLTGRQVSNLKLNPYELWLKALIASGVVVAIHAIWQKITGQTTVDGRVLGIFELDPNSSANYLAFYLAPIAVLISGFEISIITDKWKKINNIYKNIWLYDISFVSITYAIWLTGSRAAIGGVIIGTVSYFVINYWQKIKSNKIFTILLCCSIAILLIIGWQQTKPDWQATPDSGRISSSNNIRWEIWNTTVKDMIPYNMIWLKGVGLGNYQDYFTNLTKDRVNYPEWISPWAHTPHNLFLNIWVNLGLLGLISFVWILILFFKFSIFNLQFSIKNKPVIGYRLPVTVMMITILAQGLVDSPIWKNDLWIMFWLIIGLSIIVDYRTDTKNN